MLHSKQAINEVDAGRDRTRRRERERKSEREFIRNDTPYQRLSCVTVFLFGARITIRFWKTLSRALFGTLALGLIVKQTALSLSHSLSDGVSVRGNRERSGKPWLNQDSGLKGTSRRDKEGADRFGHTVPINGCFS